MRLNKESLLTNGVKSLEGMLDMIDKAPKLNIDNLDSNKTILIIIDMVNGFAKKGILSSPRVNDLISPITKLQNKCIMKDIYTLAFIDNHTKDSIELKFRPKHCIEDTDESKLVKEIEELGVDKVIKKNSTNGFVNEAFIDWKDALENKDFDNFIIVGDCTDICISQFALTLKAYFNERNLDKRVIVPINAVDTYDLDIHNGDLMNLISLYQFIDNGIEVVKSID
ncbi:cysteine hydrolase family protein [Dethiothermospora halolimnae]|uniref:cysteine hydrolase family protein n=1 Tax=Dethiothermospora halolimnae TaxID=3114390 RepID=UPI003CCC2AAE